MKTTRRFLVNKEKFFDEVIRMGLQWSLMTSVYSEGLVTLRQQSVGGASGILSMPVPWPLDVPVIGKLAAKLLGRKNVTSKISDEDFAQIWNTKKSHTFSRMFNYWDFQVNVYTDNNWPLILATIEADKDADICNPGWLLEEVTGKKEYGDLALSLKNVQ